MPRWRKSLYAGGTVFIVKATGADGGVVWLSTYDHEIPAMAKAYELSRVAGNVVDFDAVGPS